MLPTQDPDRRKSALLSLRVDAPHRLPAGHGSGTPLDRRRVRQVLVGATAARRVSDGEAGGELKLCAADQRGERIDPAAGRVLLDRFRENFETLSHIARDPLLWYAEEGAVLSELRETLLLTETAIRQVERPGHDSFTQAVLNAGVLAIAHVVEERVHRLFDRMDRLSALRQAMFRLSALLEGVPVGSIPAFEEIESLARGITMTAIDSAGEPLALIEPEFAGWTIRVAAHALNVAQVAVRLAMLVPTWRVECELAASAALLQDVAMLQVPNEILESAGPLTPPQRALVERHPAASAEIIAAMRGHDERIVAGALQHHERLDGSGYPNRLSGDAVGSLARLLAVADAFVAMQSARPHRKPHGIDATLEEIDRQAARGQLDAAWAGRLPAEPPCWLRIPVTPVPPSSAPALSAIAA